ncbi:hypothetical protein JCM10369A_36410 [Nocardioides pyridinolyticus]
MLGRAGVTFTDMVAPHPNCSPSRAQMLTGQYAHNNGVRTNAPPWGGHESLDPSAALPVWLHAAGYSTAFVGKYLHGYDEDDGPEPGWDRWRPIVGLQSPDGDRGVGLPGDYHSFVQYAAGELVRFGPEDYHTDTVAQQAKDLVGDLSAGDPPSFLWSSFIAPHGTCDGGSSRTCSAPPPPADRHADILEDVALPSLDSPSFNERDVSDKPPAIRRRPVSPQEQQHLFTQRIRTLAALDEAVAGIVAELERTGELDDTVVLFTSDNGYLFGEHRLTGKNVPYEEALGVPLLVRGPGIPRGGAAPPDGGHGRPGADDRGAHRGDADAETRRHRPHAVPRRERAAAGPGAARPGGVGRGGPATRLAVPGRPDPPLHAGAVAGAAVPGAVRPSS